MAMQQQVLAINQFVSKVLLVDPDSCIYKLLHSKRLQFTKPDATMNLKPTTERKNNKLVADDDDHITLSQCTVSPRSKYSSTFKTGNFLKRSTGLSHCLRKTAGNHKQHKGQGILSKISLKPPHTTAHNVTCI